MSDSFQRHGFLFQPARSTHDAQIADLLNDNSIPGWIELSYKTEIGFHAPLNKNIWSKSVVGVQLQGDEIGGIATRAVHPSFLNGAEAEIGWLGQLRIAPKFQKRVHLLRSGFDAIHQFLHERKQTPYYLASIIAENKNARRILEAGLDGFPTFEPILNYRVLAFSTQQAKAKISKFIRQAQPEEMPEIVEFINRINCRFDFSPRLNLNLNAGQASPIGWLGLSASDFLVHEDAGKISGVISIWDQQKHRHMQVQGYKYLSPFMRRIANAISPLTKLPKLPDPGDNLRQIYLSLPAIEEGKHEVARELYSAALTWAEQRGAALCLAGFTENEFQQMQTLRLKHYNYDSIIYRVYWPEDENLVNKSMSACTKIEIALL